MHKSANFKSEILRSQIGPVQFAISVFGFEIHGFVQFRVFRFT